MKADPKGAQGTTIVALFLFLVGTAFATKAAGQSVCQPFSPILCPRLLLQEGDKIPNLSGNVLGVDKQEGAVSVSFSGRDEFFTTEIDASGEFTLQFVPSGPYDVLVTQRGRALLYERVNVFDNQTILQVSNDKPLLKPGHLHLPGDEFD